MITEFNKVNLKNVREDISAILSKYAKETGIELSIGNIRFTSGTFSAKLDAKIKGAKTEVDNVLAYMMTVEKLKANGLDGRVLTKYNTRGKAYPYIYTQNGKSFKCSPDSAKRYFSI